MGVLAGPELGDKPRCSTRRRHLPDPLALPAVVDHVVLAPDRPPNESIKVDNRRRQAPVDVDPLEPSRDVVAVEADLGRTLGQALEHLQSRQAGLGEDDRLALTGGQLGHPGLDVAAQVVDLQFNWAVQQATSDLDDATRKQLDRGQRVTELMKQKQYSPMSVGEMAVSLFAADRGYLDDVNLDKIGAFETALVDHVSSSQADLLGELNEGNWNDDLEGQLTAVLDDFKATGSW